MGRSPLRVERLAPREACSGLSRGAARYGLYGYALRQSSVAHKLYKIKKDIARTANSELGDWNCAATAGEIHDKSKRDGEREGPLKV